MLKRLRRQLFAVLCHTGAMRDIAASRWRARRLLILCYHGISLADEHEWNSQLYISPDMFRARLEMVKRGGYNVLPLDEALARLSEGSLPARSVAITFDDGAHDFHAQALPLLREYGYPATVYLTTYYSEFQRPVFDTAASYLLWRGRARALRPGSARSGLAGGAGGEGGAGGAMASLGQIVPRLAEFDLSTEPGRRVAALWLRDYADSEKLSAAGKHDLLGHMADALGLDYGAIFARRLLFLMTPDEVREVAAAGVDVQLHTHRHRTPGDRSAFLREIADNRASIERILGPGRRTHFCYPSGVYEPQFPAWLREAGVRSATTCDFRLASTADDMLLLPRLVDTGNITGVEFEACLAGVADLFPHRRRAQPGNGVRHHFRARVAGNGAVGNDA
jgi:peptidoglycan/xylan/chitin deacetylase (PgdA/CDA1 family)